MSAPCRVALCHYQLGADMPAPAVLPLSRHLCASQELDNAVHARVLAEQARADADRSKAEHMTGLAQAETQVLQQVERSVEAEKKAFSRAQRWVREVKVRGH